MKQHGMKSLNNLDLFCSRHSYDSERIGQFGRIFRTSNGASPLYTKPQVLTELGKAGGIMDSQNRAQFSTTVPMGMVYLGQFIDHDITLDTISKLNQVNDPTSIQNGRTPQLDLDCIFGEGPEDEPFMFVDGRNLRLLTGETNHNYNQSNSLERNDLARTASGVAIIGDSRNDENRIISQLQLLFIRFYNKIYDVLEAEHGSGDPQYLYEEARKLTTWHYQWIVIHEFLPTMIGKKLVKNIQTEGRKWYRPCDKPFIPIEFSTAAYRFGHSMIGQNVRLRNNGATQSIFSSAVGRGFSPITSRSQVIDWDQFFAINGSHQFTEKLDIKMASDLLNLPFFPPSTPAEQRSLATRNLMRGNSFLLPSGENVANIMGVDSTVIDRVKSYMETNFGTIYNEIEGCTPLWLYILAEAGAIGKDDMEGEGLGPVGGTIVGEVILGLIEEDEHSFLGTNRNWKPTLAVNNDFTMKDLVEFTES